MCLFHSPNPNLACLSDTRGSETKDEVSRLADASAVECLLLLVTLVFFLFCFSDVVTQAVVYSHVKIKPSADAASSSSNKRADADDVTYSEVLVLYPQSKS